MAKDLTSLVNSTLVEATQALIQNAEATTAQVQRVSLTESTDTPRGQGIAQLGSLRRAANALADTTATLNDAITRYVVAYITSLAVQGTKVQKILAHFSSELMSIAQDVLHWTSDDNSVMREILELCYSQSLHTSGTLHLDNYSIPQCEAERKQWEEVWIGSWVAALSECPNGLTLFYSPACRLSQWNFADVPRYLFRAFDPKSFGQSDENVVASMESISETSEHSKYWRGGNDNLMSWSSSLLFVIQCAIWRCHRPGGGCGQDEVKICTVDTRKFPRGQFARDMILLRAYRKIPELDKEAKDFFDFRLTTQYYDNGEYLSQGKVHHTGRSCVFPLDQLIQAGLHNLFPEFAEKSAMGSWTNRVKDLRSKWSDKHRTTRVDVQTALEVARACFNTFNAPDIALLLLSFKNRKLQATTRTSQFHNGDYGPAEVQRYMEIADTMMLNDQDDGGASSRLSPSDTQLLETIFDCT
ncbi:hypothetical protein F5Y19DRAFT_484126 [Xylariaceae sp. FL1651]|nr:hypothetical protein F5Y19DRAFT_484126 [Xylariaceae sp. FL1651]